jgi:hypothetical protein
MKTNFKHRIPYTVYCTPFYYASVVAPWRLASNTFGDQEMLYELPISCLIPKWVVDLWALLWCGLYRNRMNGASAIDIKHLLKIKIWVEILSQHIRLDFSPRRE